MNCWLWDGGDNGAGYGQTTWEGRTQLVHRLVYAAVWGPIPAGMEIDHLCRQRACYNPWHLEAVTRRENQRRGMGVAGLNARKTTCPKGHPYADRLNYRGGRKCLVCRREEWKRWKARQA